MELIIDFILITGIVIGSLILFFLFKKDKKELPQYLLIVLFLFLLCEFIISYFFLHEIYFIKLPSIIFSSAITWFLGPLIFLYIKSLFTDEKKLIKKNLIHFIPYVVNLVLKSIIYIIYFPSDIDNATYMQIFEKKWVLDVVLSDLYFILYLLLTLRMFYRFKKAIKSNYSNLTEHDFIWLKYMLFGYLLVMSVDTFISIIGLYSLYGFYITIITTVIVIIYLGYYGINQSRILLPDFLIIEEVDNEGDTKKANKNQLSHSSDQEIKELKLSLENILKNDKPYLDENLTLKKLADLIPTSDKKLSTLLNQYMDISFYDIINKQRVEAVKEKMIAENSKKYSLMGIAYDCGFNSKSSFIRTFKKETGFSPSEYKKQLQQ